MEPREADGSSRCPSLQQMQTGPFGAYFQPHGILAGFSQARPLAITHTPAAMRLPAVSVSPSSTMPSPSPGPSPNPNPSDSFLLDTVSHGTHQQMIPTSTIDMNIAMAMALPPSDPVKRKRGRPRKYASDSNGVGLGLSPSPRSISSPSEKKARGSGSSKKAQLSALGAPGQGFTPYVLTVAAGEDVAMKIIAFSQHCPWAVCILSANGAISNATLRHAGICGGYVTYEGRFEIISLSGLFILTENANAGGLSGGLSVALAGPDGKLIGGGVAGLLMAASPVQVIVGTFFPESRKSQIRVDDKPVLSSQNAASVAGLHSLVPVSSQSHIDAVVSMQDHSSMHAVRENIDEQHHQVSQIICLQSSDWAASQLALEARSDGDPVTSLPGGC